ncbi:relaxase MobL [Arthrobacter sp. efr-133-TYG-118]|uniref:relaxase MobL n=1 Tax=Arthrobacter sp. efr-133-TYG-118 TaxID=3040279 RepID=UPI0025502359|nr:relaxase MobL [Arthrobacter sp. efr-133-TYG-118]
MNLRASVVIVNEFSVPQPGGKGSRGGTPGAYVERYMARADAVESLAPIQRLRTDDFILRYMAREIAVERPGVTRSGAKNAMKQAQGEGGVAFGYGSVSLSDEQLRAASKDIQMGFESGKTVFKTVLSFDEEYLKKHGIVDADFRCENRGDYRGHIDQMKLRMAIMHGLNRMSSGASGFDDFRYVATLQVDTEHVHAHIAGYDAGTGRLMPNGQQKGKLLDRHKSRLRRGVDAWLDEKQAVAHLSSAVGYERRNVTTFIKRWAHERMRAESLPQFLLACLPPDRRLWRAGTNDMRMRKANEIVTELVTEQLGRAGSPMPAAMEKIVDYANERRAKESLTTDAWQRLVDAGRAQIIERAVNGVYQLVRALPPDELRIRTPMLEVMGMDYEQMAALAHDRQDAARQETDNDLVSFGFRLRSYASRLDHHRERAAAYRDLIRQWEKADAAGVAVEDSRPLYDFYRFEEEYQRRLMAKYQHFLPFVGDEHAWYEQHKQVSEYGQRLLSLMSLRQDVSLQRMKEGEDAERLGREIYGQPGGRLLTEGAGGRAVLDHRIAAMRRSYDAQLDDLRADLAASGLVLLPVATNTGKRGQNVPAAAAEALSPLATRIEKGAAYDFDEVKALDLHHLGYDFFSDAEIGGKARRTFALEAQHRRRLLIGAMTYLDESGQAEAIAGLPVDDVASMTKLAAKLARDAAETGAGLLPSRFAELRAQQEIEKTRRHAVTSLDAGLAVRLQGRIDQAAIEATSSFDYEANRELYGVGSSPAGD